MSGLLGTYNGTEEDYFNKVLNQLVGFNQEPQDQFVDNRSTSAGSPVVDYRTQAQKDVDTMNQSQGLVDITLDTVIPAGQAIAGAMRVGSGLGLKGLQHMENLRKGRGAANFVDDEGRREAMRLAGAGVGAGAIASAPVINIATKGLGLGDNVIAANASGAPMSIANAVAKENAMSGGLNHIMLGKHSSLPGLPSVVANQEKMKTIVDNTMRKMEKKGLPVAPARRSSKADGEMYGRSRMGEDGTHITGTDDFSRASSKDSGYELTDDMKAALGDDLDEFYRLGEKIKGSEQKMINVRDKSNLKRQKALTSKEPVLSPKEINSELKRQGKNLSESKKKLKEAEDIKKRDMNDQSLREEYDMDALEWEYDNPISEQMDNIIKYEERINALNSQMNKLQKTGKYK